MSHLNRSWPDLIVSAREVNLYSPNAVLYFNKQIAMTTDISSSCNTGYKDSTLNFLGKSGDCANMALVNDVIYHECGHGLDDFTGPGSRFGGGMTDSVFSEAIGDQSYKIVQRLADEDHNPATRHSDSMTVQVFNSSGQEIAKCTVRFSKK